MNLYIRLVLGIVLGTSLFSCSNFENRVERCVQEQLELHPKSELTDIYKYFFQDRFGPGHLAPDSARAMAYLDYEMGIATRFEAHDYQELNFVGNFTRVNLSILKEGKITEKELLDAFMKSAQDFTLPKVSEWHTEWNRILAIITPLTSDLRHFTRDQRMIDSLLTSGEYVVHHSKAYLEAYDPHYRIIGKRVLESLNLSGD